MCGQLFICQGLLLPSPTFSHLVSLVILCFVIPPLLSSRRSEKTLYHVTKCPLFIHTENTPKDGSGKSENINPFFLGNSSIFINIGSVIFIVDTPLQTIFLSLLWMNSLTLYFHHVIARVKELLMFHIGILLFCHLAELSILKGYPIDSFWFFWADHIICICFLFICQSLYILIYSHAYIGSSEFAVVSTFPWLWWERLFMSLYVVTLTHTPPLKDYASPLQIRYIKPLQ